MASASITKRGEGRFVVRYRLGGRATPVLHGGSFRTQKEARIRRDMIAGELAAGRNPKALLNQLSRKPPVVETFAQAAERYRASRIDVEDHTRSMIGVYAKKISETFGTRDPHSITSDEVGDWIAAVGLKPTTLRVYLRTFRAVLAYVSVDQNPAEGHRLPKIELEEVRPPSKREFARIIEHVSAQYMFALVVLEATGLRLNELCSLEWGDVDFAEGRLRVPRGKTRAARRWIPLREDVLVALAETPMEDRRGRVFAHSDSGIQAAMDAACVRAGVTKYSPHDLRHRYISLLVKQGVPITEVALVAGHGRRSVTWDTYAHVLLDE